ncbi:hypothetical protein SFC66_04590 [Terribacillus saccharophilus]|uniref:hypothetical protein n=1 Tax=Terribacillus saccharophilus TaxID=361277 RepID=UPI003981FAE6
MTKVLCTVLLTILLLSACSESSAINFSELEIAPGKVQEQIDTNHTLQLISEKDGTLYIVFQSNGEVASDLEVQGDTLTVKLDEENERC